MQLIIRGPQTVLILIFPLAERSLSTIVYKTSYKRNFRQQIVEDEKTFFIFSVGRDSGSAAPDPVPEQIGPQDSAVLPEAVARPRA